MVHLTEILERLDFLRMASGNALVGDAVENGNTSAGYLTEYLTEVRGGIIGTPINGSGYQLPSKITAILY
jgi:hypothetical protein